MVGLFSALCIFGILSVPGGAYAKCVARIYEEQDTTNPYDVSTFREQINDFYGVPDSTYKGRPEQFDTNKYITFYDDFDLKVLECGLTTDVNYCSEDSIVSIDTNHTLGDEYVYEPKIYKCVVSTIGSAYSWVEVQIPTCSVDNNCENGTWVAPGNFKGESNGLYTIFNGNPCYECICNDGYKENENGKCIEVMGAVTEEVEITDTESEAASSVEILPENTEETPADDANKNNNGINLVNPVSPTDWDAMDAMIENLPEIGEACKNMDLPQFATAGVYINNGVSVVCAATECKSGTYLVLNSSGVSQGWCVASTYCTNDGEHLNIIDGTKTDLQCVSDANNENNNGNNNNTNVNAPDASNGAGPENTPPQTNVGDSTDTRNECERGVAGYVMFEGVCMPTAQMQQIQQQRIQAQQQAQQNAVITNLRNQIQRQANIIQDIEDAHSDDKVTVWKDAEGKFNTSRLLSDSIAGVALGTVGGLVVNKVVKDKHVETGFEELSCAIGGETVADFDERFTITGAVNKEQCIGNNVGFGNVYVWAARNSDGTDYSRMVEDINNPDNNACWVRIDIESSNAKLNVSDVPSRWFVVGQQITCGEWTARETLRQRALDARRGVRTWATVGGAVGGAGVGVGLMELFGNRLIGGKVMGQKSLDEMELLYSQMSETERREYQAAADKLVELCDELYQKGATSPLCE